MALELVPRIATRAVAVVLASHALGGCAFLPLPFGRDPFVESGATTVQLDVENWNFYDATIYATPQGGARLRVGDVVGNGTRSFTIPLDAPNDVRFRIELLADGWCETYPIAVTPGDELGLRIVPDFPGAANCESRGGG
jgi:hypothetical protein